MYPVLPHITWEERREPRFGPLFLVSVCMMVSSGLAGAHVQPCPRNKIELLAISSWLLAKPGEVWQKAKG